MDSFRQNTKPTCDKEKKTKSEGPKLTNHPNICGRKSKCKSICGKSQNAQNFGVTNQKKAKGTIEMSNVN